MDFDDKTGSWPAVYFIKEDLKSEKQLLLEDMRELALTYWAGTDPILDAMLKDITKRIEEINGILLKVTNGGYNAPEE